MGSKCVRGFASRPSDAYQSQCDPPWRGSRHFGGEIYHTAAWPETVVEFRDKRVAVIGTGSSGIQVISSIAPEAERLFVLQRTPVYVFPAYNGPLDAEFVSAFKERFASIEHSADIPGEVPWPH